MQESLCYGEPPLPETDTLLLNLTPLTDLIEMMLLGIDRHRHQTPPIDDIGAPRCGPPLLGSVLSSLSKLLPPALEKSRQREARNQNIESGRSVHRLPMSGVW